MSYYAVLDFCLHFHTFRNIDLFHQGLYHLRVRLYHDSDYNANEKERFLDPSIPLDQSLIVNSTAHCHAAHPYALLPNRTSDSDFKRPVLPSLRPLGVPLPQPEANNNKKKTSHHYVYPSVINNELQYAQTTTFLIRYCDEEVELNDFCQFRIELDLCKKNVLNSPIFIEIDLMYADQLDQTEQTNTTNQDVSDSNKFSTLHNSTSFHSVAYQVYKLHLSVLGMHQYIPIIFDEFHYSMCSLMIHSILLDIRCRVRSNTYPCQYQPRHRLRRLPPSLSYITDVSQSNTNNTLTPASSSIQQSLPAVSSSIQLTTSFSDFLQKGHRGLYQSNGIQLNATLDHPLVFQDTVKSTLSNLSSSILKADFLHSEYIRLLLHSLTELNFFFRHMTYRCLSPKQRQLLGCTFDLHPVEIPGGDMILFPGTGVTDNSKKQKELGQPLSTTITTDSLSSVLPSPLFSGTSPCGTGSSFYSEADLLTIVFHIPSEIIQEELNRIKEEHLFSETVNPQDDDVLLETTQPFIKNTAIEIRGHIPKLSSRLSSSYNNEIAEILTQDFQLISGQIMNNWQRFINVLPSIQSELDCFLRGTYNTRIADHWRESIFRETCSEEHMTISGDKSVWELHQKIADHLRKSRRYLSVEPLPVEDIFMMPLPTLSPILFEQRYICKTNDNLPIPNDSFITLNELSNKVMPHTFFKQYVGIHLIVLVHGFQGNSYDMRLLKNAVSASHPSAIFLCSASNEECTEGCIEKMGKRLAEEILRFVDEWCPGSILGRLSFICHSLGGVIARSALPQLNTLWSKFYTFLSLSSPHLGYMYSSNKLVDAGIWVLKKWKKSLSLQQLTLSDAKNIRESFLYKLSTSSEALGQFQQVCLVSSYQDQYVPFDSARVEVSEKSENNARLGKIYTDMAKLVLRHVKPENLIRFDVNFLIPDKTFDTFIGRAAHIQFLENHVLMQMLIQGYPLLFQ